jgi:hypothetical protein
VKAYSLTGPQGIVLLADSQETEVMVLVASLCRLVHALCGPDYPMSLTTELNTSSYADKSGHVANDYHMAVTGPSLQDYLFPLPRIRLILEPNTYHLNRYQSPLLGD